VTSSGAPRVAMTVNSSTSPRGVCSLSETTGWVAGSTAARRGGRTRPPRLAWRGRARGRRGCGASAGESAARCMRRSLTRSGAGRPDERRGGAS
jgi:hypothetical protein